MAEPRDTRKLVAIPRLMVSAAALFAVWLTYRTHHQHATGTVIVGGTPFAVEDCKKVPMGDQLVAADLRGPDGHVLRLVGNGDNVQVFLLAKVPVTATIVITQRDCSEWTVRLSADYPGPLEVVGGEVSINCVVGGMKVNGTASFDHCPS